MGEAQLLIAGLLVAVAGLSALARVLAVPYPIVLVVGGAAFGFIPGTPEVRLDPQVVLVIFLPPLLYGASIFANFGDLRANVRRLPLSTIGLVLLTMGAVACVAHALVRGLPWAAAFALGAIVSPTDPLAATTIMRRLQVPRRLVSAVEGEGLFNDATALVCYRVAVAAVVAGTFSLADAGASFIADAAGGVAIGFAVGWIASWIRERTTDDQVNVTISLLSGYAAYIPADAIGASGVLSVVTAGIYMGIRGPRILPVGTRLQGYFVWDILDFIVNAILFVLIGLQLHSIVATLGTYSATTLAAYALAVTGAVLGTRLLWFFTVPSLVRATDRRPTQQAGHMGAGWRLVIAWGGMRGAVSLAVAFALPLTTHDGHPFPQRELIIFLTFSVIFFTLVVQGLSLPALIRRLRIAEDDPDAQEVLRARLIATTAALAQIDTLAEEEWTRDDTVERMRALYRYRKRRLAARAGKIEDEGYEDRSLAYQHMVQLVLWAQRDALLQMRSEGTLSNEVMNRILRELDLEESRLETTGTPQAPATRPPSATTHA
jgi:CPA1 family monovalent cation:H+ antiporter